MRVPLFFAGLAVSLAPVPAVAQGAFNMGGLTGTLSQDAVTQAEEERAARVAPRTRTTAYRAFARKCAARYRVGAKTRRLPSMRALDRRCRAARL